MELLELLDELVELDELELEDEELEVSEVAAEVVVPLQDVIFAAVLK